MVWVNENRQTGQFIVTAKFKIKPETYRLMKDAQRQGKLSLVFDIYQWKEFHYASYTAKCITTISQNQLRDFKIQTQLRLSKLCDQYDSMAHKL